MEISNLSRKEKQELLNTLLMDKELNCVFQGAYASSEGVQDMIEYSREKGSEISTIVEESDDPQTIWNEKLNKCVPIPTTDIWTGICTG